MYLYFLDKITQDSQTLWEKTKSKYEVKCRILIESFSSYILASGRKNLHERELVATLVLESLSHICTILPIDYPRGVIKDEFGKPYFDDTSLGFSISHNEDMVLVAYEKEGAVGADVESEIPCVKTEKISARFPAIASLKTEISNEEIEAFLMDENGNFKPITLSSADDDFTAKWTAAEAIMKCDGRGFSTISDLDRLQKEMMILTKTVHFGDKKVYVSCAKKSNK